MPKGRNKTIATVVCIGQTHFSTAARQLNLLTNRFDALIIGVETSYESTLQLRSALNHPEIRWLDIKPGEAGQLLEYALETFASEYDYLLWFDPEWGMAQTGLLERNALTADAYQIRCTSLDGFENWRTTLLSTRLKWHYDIATQQPVSDSNTTYTEHIDALLMISTSSEKTEKQNAAQSIKALITQHDKQPKNSRCKFYLGHYYLRVGDKRTAKSWFESCLRQSPEDPVEHALALYYVAELSRQTVGVNVSQYYEAFELAPNRAEALSVLVRHFIEEKQLDKAFQLAKIAFDIPRPRDSYPIDYRIYNFQIASDLVSLSQQQSAHKTCIAAASWILEKNILPEQTDEKFREIRKLSLQHFYPVYPLSISRKNKISAIVSFRNAGHYLQLCINSLKQQKYDNFHVYLIDDASDDGCTDALKLDQRFTLIKRTQRMEALYNQHDILLNYCDEEDIAFFLDGDDWLHGDDVFSYINRLFNQSGCWVSYGQCVKAHSTYKLCKPMEIRAHEDYRHLGSELKYPIHPRCHRVGLYHRIADQDPDYLCLRDEDGEFYKPGSDYAHMRALFQLAGPEKIRFVDKSLYIYNFSNPLSTHNTQHENMLEACLRISQGKCLKTINDYKAEQQPVTHADKKTALLVISLEGLDSVLVRKWADAGLLPALKSLMDKGGETELAIEPGFFSTDAFLTSCVTGEKPQTHQNLWADVLNNGSYDLIPTEGAALSTGRPYWDVLSDEGFQVCSLNYYALPLSKSANVSQLQNWGVHVSWGKLRSHPETLAQDVRQRFGDEHLNVGSERTSKATVQTHLALKEKLLNRVETKREAYQHYLESGQWDVYHVCFDEAHDIGHQLWHIHAPDPLTPEASWHEKYGDPLLEIYQALDRSIERLYQASGGADMMVIAGSGMQASSSCSRQINEMLKRIQCKETGEDQASLESDWLKQSAFTLQSNPQLGAIRLNVAGREPAGWVQPGHQFTHWCDVIEAGLMSFVNAQTGQTIVEQIIRTRDKKALSKLSSLGDSLPDLIVIWRRTPLPEQVRSSIYGDIGIELPVGNPLSYRTGDHNSNAALYTNLNLRKTSEKALAVEAIAPTICGYFGVEMPGCAAIPAKVSKKTP